LSSSIADRNRYTIASAVVGSVPLSFMIETDRNFLTDRTNDRQTKAGRNSANVRGTA